MRQVVITCADCGTNQRVLFEIAAVGFECEHCQRRLCLPEELAAAVRQVHWVAFALCGTAVVSLLLNLSLILALTGGGQINDPWMSRFVICSVVADPILAIYTLYGAYYVRALTHYSFAMSACLTAMICLPLSCCLLGIPVGIWGLVVLSRSIVRQQFQSTGVDVAGIR